NGKRPDLLGAFGFASLLAAGPVVLPLELLNAPGGIDELHLAGEERVTDRADFDRNVLLGAARGELVAAATSDGRFFVLGMDVLLHDSLQGGIFQETVL